MLSTHEVESLYRSHSGHLHRVVQGDARAPEEVVEDACQHAWASVLSHRERVEEPAAFTWLARTAVHEAWRLTAQEPADELEAGLMIASASSPPEIVELRERLAEMRRLPSRQQRLLWLQAAGLSYAEMARYEGASTRTVQRQLLRGRRAARELGT